MQAPVLNNPEINRLLAAAVVNRKFCKLLLADPGAAIDAGYHGDTFQFSAEETRLLQSIHAATLQDFATHLFTLESTVAEQTNTSASEIQTTGAVAHKVRVRL